MPSYTVLLDTNCAFSPKPENAVSEGLLKAIGKIRRLAAVKFLMPEIVMLELAYQQFRVAEQACSNLVKNAATIKAATSIETAHPPTNQNLRDSAKAEIQRVLIEAEIILIPTPFESIDWKSVVEDSCWRNSTFESPPDEELLFEKGFRDRIILESLLAALRNSPADHSVVVSGDKLLRKAAKERCKSAKLTPDFHDTIGIFLEQVQLLNKTKSEGFTKRVFGTISKYFNTSGSKVCVFKSCNLAESLVAKFGAELRDPNLFSAYREIEKIEPESKRRGEYARFGQKYDPSRFAVGSGLRFKIGRTHFETGHNDLRYHWKTDIEVACLHQDVTPPRSFRPRPFSWIQFKTVEVRWSCVISESDGEYSDPTIDEVTEVFGKRFLPATGDISLLMSYDLPIFPSISWDDDRREWEMSDRVAFEEPTEDTEEHS